MDKRFQFSMRRLFCVVSFLCIYAWNASLYLRHDSSPAAFVIGAVVLAVAFGLLMLLFLSPNRFSR